MSSHLMIAVNALFFVSIAGIAEAGVKSKAAKEAAEYVAQKFGKEAIEEGAETFARKVEVLAVKHGDEAISAVKKVGPTTLRIVEEAGENGPQAIKLMARHGDNALWVVAKKNRMAIFVKYGDDAAEAMMKHGELAEPLIQTMGKPAAGALTAVSKQNGRRLAMMAEDGTLNQIGRSNELLPVVTKYGDAAMDFIWRNKGALTVATTLTAFLSDPKPFIDGTVELAKPIAEAPGKIATEVARNTDWTVVTCALLTVGGILFWLRRKSHRRTVAQRLIGKTKGPEQSCSAQ